jgi:ABC-type lipoprotein export system ATPase subunit
MKLIGQINRDEGATFLISTHDEMIVLGDRVLV